ncbi:uncharacterized protein LOC143681162 isoform X2 [Tamandua tetradactyla]|uniref:uncharacterized protein LOC143681162 isoform X2 n=1 Tax=Tamandua tetradactyla TaxID=48850 RepID=UPI00405471A2
MGDSRERQACVSSENGKSLGSPQLPSDLNHHSSLHLPKSHRNEEVSDGIQCRQRGFSPSFRFLTSPGGMPVTIRAVMDPGQFLEPGTREHYSSDCSAGLQMLVPKGGFSHQKTKQLFH